MTTWSGDQLARIAAADELVIQAGRADGTLRGPIPVWVVRDGDALYVRSYKGERGSWYRAAVARAGRISAGGVEAEVTFAPEADPAANDRIDAAYRTKYRRFGASYVEPMIAPAARAATLKILPARTPAHG